MSIKRLSEYGIEEGLDIIADIIEPIANIAEDDRFKELFKKDEVDVDVRTYAIRKIKKSIPDLIKSHKPDIISILATLNEMSVDDYVKEKGKVLYIINDIMHALNDPDLTELFTSAQTGETSGSSGSVLEIMQEEA